MTARLAISVEGPTEYEFCRELLGPHLATFGVWAEAKIIVTKHNIASTNAKGGSVSLDRVIAEVTPLLHCFDRVTTFYDFYGFKGRLPDEAPEALCRRIAAGLGQPRHLLPYVQVHEFEALLFASPAAVGTFLRCPQVASEMSEVLTACGGAEEINDSPQTAPARRLERAFSNHLRQRYDKKFHGPLLLIEIGLPAIRAACPRFNAWLTQLEQAGGEP